MRLLPSRKRDENSDRVKARARLDKRSSGEVIDWADQVGSGIARALQDYRRYEAKESLEEAKTGAVALLACLDVLESRAQ